MESGTFQSTSFPNPPRARPPMGTPLIFNSRGPPGIGLRVILTIRDPF